MQVNFSWSSFVEIITDVGLVFSIFISNSFFVELDFFVLLWKHIFCHVLLEETLVVRAWAFLHQFYAKHK